MSTAQNKNSLRTMFISILVGALTTFILIAIFAAILTFFDLSEGVSVILSTIAIVLGAYVCGYLAGYIGKEKGLLSGLTSGASFYVIVAIIAVIITKSGLTSLFFIRLVLCLIFSAVGGIVGLNKTLKRTSTL